MSEPVPVTRDDSVVVFDGVCNLCQGSVQFLLRHERNHELRFAAAQSSAGTTLLAAFGLSAAELNSVVLVEGGRAYQKSSAVLHLVPHLGWAWQWLRLGWLLPRRVRDWLYDALAARRYAWFGQSASCLLPTRALAERFLC